MQLNLNRVLHHVARALEVLITVQLAGWVIIALLVLVTVSQA